MATDAGLEEEATEGAGGRRELEEAGSGPPAPLERVWPWDT